MRDIKAYTDSILLKATKEGEQLREEASRRRQAFLSEQKKQLEQEHVLKRGEISRFLDEAHEQRLAAKRRAMQKELSGYRQQLMALTFDQALEQLNALSFERMLGLFQRAVNSLPEKGTYEAVFGSITAERIPADAFAKAVLPPQGVHLSYAQEPLPGEGGFLLRSGVVDYVFLFKDMLQEIRDKKGSQIIRRLFDQEAL